MKVIFSSTDKISISLLKSLLDQDGIKSFCFDESINSMQGGIDAFPIRIAVPNFEFDKALITLNYFFSKCEGLKYDK